MAPKVSRARTASAWAGPHRDGKTPISKLQERLIKKHDAPEDDLERDMSKMFGQLAKENLIELE